MEQKKSCPTLSETHLLSFFGLMRRFFCHCLSNGREGHKRANFALVKGGTKGASASFSPGQHASLLKLAKRKRYNARAGEGSAQNVDHQDLSKLNRRLKVAVLCSKKIGSEENCFSGRTLVPLSTENSFRPLPGNRLGNMRITQTPKKKEVEMAFS